MGESEGAVGESGGAVVESERAVGESEGAAGGGGPPGEWGRVGAGRRGQ